MSIICCFDKHLPNGSNHLSETFRYQVIDYEGLCEYMMMCTQIIHIIGCIPVILSQLLINQGEILFREKQDLVDFVYNSV